MKHLIRLFLLMAVLIPGLTVLAADGDTTKLYNPAANAEQDIAALLVKAKKENKHILVEVGGNWCSWCIRFERFVKTSPELTSILDNNYLVYHLNYSPENKNEAILKTMGFPQRFGFPVFLILDANGQRLHTQDSALLEQGNLYSMEKIKSFFVNWTPNVLKEAYYKN